MGDTPKPSAGTNPCTLLRFRICRLQRPSRGFAFLHAPWSSLSHRCGVGENLVFARRSQIERVEAGFEPAWNPLQGGWSQAKPSVCPSHEAFSPLDPPLLWCYEPRAMSRKLMADNSWSGTCIGHCQAIPDRQRRRTIAILCCRNLGGPHRQFADCHDRTLRSP